MGKRVRGLQYGDAMLTGVAIGREIAEGASRDVPVNARCDKCGCEMRCSPAILATVKRGVVDHMCGGTFLALHSSQMPAALPGGAPPEPTTDELSAARGEGGA